MIQWALILGRSHSGTFWSIVFLKMTHSPKKKLPWFPRRALGLQPSRLAAGKLAIDDLVNDGVVHGCWLCQQGWYHWELDGDRVGPSKGWPDRDHGVGNPGEEEPCADQHCHLVRAEKRQQGLSRAAWHWHSSTQLGRMQFHRKEKKNYNLLFHINLQCE